VRANHKREQAPPRPRSCFHGRIDDPVRRARSRLVRSRSVTRSSYSDRCCRIAGAARANAVPVVLLSTEAPTLSREHAMNRRRDGNGSRVRPPCGTTNSAGDSLDVVGALEPTTARCRPSAYVKSVWVTSESFSGSGHRALSRISGTDCGDCAASNCSSGEGRGETSSRGAGGPEVSPGGLSWRPMLDRERVAVSGRFERHPVRVVALGRRRPPPVQLSTDGLARSARKVADFDEVAHRDGGFSALVYPPSSLRETDTGSAHGSSGDSLVR